MSTETPEAPVAPEPSATPRPKRTGRDWLEHVLLVLILIIATLLIVIGAGWWWFFMRPDSDVSAGRPVQIEIPAGATTGEIAEQLSSAGVVSNANMFRLQVRLEGVGSELKSGVYDLSTGMSYEDVTRELTEGPQYVYRSVTIPEGFVIDQIAERLEAQAGIPAKEFLALAKSGAKEFAAERPYLSDAYGGSLEGYLFPKTYRIREGASARSVIEMMLDQFETETADLDMSYPESRGMGLADVVTMASMIEREVRVPKERELVSSVIYNRLAKSMPLEIDATIEYVLPGNRFRLKASDIRIDSPYNTYRNKGLPPGPIASPGLASLEAATAPAQTAYLYYVLTAKDGSHTFAETREEFLIAKEKSKEVFGQ